MTSSFDPSELTIPANTDVTLKLVNEGKATHSLTVDGAGVASPNVAGGETYELTVNLPPGDYRIGCDVPGHRLAGMTGVLHVAG
jgi:uncharacterized cupredoxin-like copper-binding protein